LKAKKKKMQSSGMMKSSINLKLILISDTQLTSELHEVYNSMTSDLQTMKNSASIRSQLQFAPSKSILVIVNDFLAMKEISSRLFSSTTNYFVRCVLCNPFDKSKQKEVVLSHCIGEYIDLKDRIVHTLVVVRTLEEIQPSFFDIKVTLGNQALTLKISPSTTVSLVAQLFVRKSGQVKEIKDKDGILVAKSNGSLIGDETKMADCFKQDGTLLELEFLENHRILNVGILGDEIKQIECIQVLCLRTLSIRSLMEKINILRDVLSKRLLVFDGNQKALNIEEDSVVTVCDILRVSASPKMYHIILVPL
jgi:hypothetical protein